MEKKIAIVTTGRADFGILRNLLNRIAAEPAFIPLLIASGTHATGETSSSREELEASGFPVSYWIDDLKFDNNRSADVIGTIANSLIKYKICWESLCPDVVLVLGDRFELLPPCLSAFFLKIPIAHVFGGEKTIGAFDDTTRHIITKLASLHFVAADEYRNRVIQLGEQPADVHTVGPLSLDISFEDHCLSKAELERHLGCSLDNLLLVTYHPTTNSTDDPKIIHHLFECLLKEFRNFTVLVTGTNIDPGNSAIVESKERFSQLHPRCIFRENLGNKNYLSLMAIAYAVIGNSSSGIIEAPACEVATVNIGNRQKGRLMAESIFSTTGTDPADLKKAIDDAISWSKIHRSRPVSFYRPYGGFKNGAASEILNILKNQRTPAAPKLFYDISVSNLLK